MTSDVEIKAYLQGLAQRVQRLEEEARGIIGRKARIVSKFNGQPYGGRSRKPLTGKVVEITSVYLCPDGTYSFHSARPDWINAGFGPNDIEFL
jgi:hypothetical protein